jgi:hypothetical protein
MSFKTSSVFRVFHNARMTVPLPLLGRADGLIE